MSLLSVKSMFGRSRGAHRVTAVPEARPVNVLLFVTLTLMCIGLVMMTSASMDIGNSLSGDPLYFFKRQVFFIGLGLVFMLVALGIDMKVWYRISHILLIVAAVLLVMVLIPGVGTVVNGSARWLDLGFYRLQPSEMTKIFMIMYMAAYLSRRRDEVHEDWAGFLKPMAILVLLVVLLYLEPDHGAMVILMATAFTMLFLAGARLHRFMLIVMLSFAGVAGLAILKPHVISRLTSFLNPWADEYVYGEGYQLTQALIAFGRGEWVGTGLGNSLQKLYFLPEAHTDFILSIIAEETGLLGVVVVMALFVVLITQALRIGRAAEQQGAYFVSYVAYGIGMLFATQTFINFGVNTGLLPTKGLTLPFLSYGGNSLLISCFIVGVLMRAQFELQTGRLRPDSEMMAVDFEQDMEAKV
ncbi:MAG: putative lipid II flippase FtsW [Pseudohongiella sp.]|nr:putative lipid II flippase FtsW [Pseudohongiella sp.]MDO9520882.1 putative lipid II flippase FtsW [Pseudohongiella sp.]MDP2128055.1 putative lipid II flippase FtsW [Pseudohongiella sp.]